MLVIYVSILGLILEHSQWLLFFPEDKVHSLSWVFETKRLMLILKLAKFPYLAKSLERNLIVETFDHP